MKISLLHGNYAKHSAVTTKRAKRLRLRPVAVFRKLLKSTLMYKIKMCWLCIFTAVLKSRKQLSLELSFENQVTVVRFKYWKQK